MSAAEGVAFAVLCAVLFFVLRESKSPHGALLLLIGGLALLFSSLSQVLSLGILSSLSALLGEEEGKTLVKVLGVGLLVDVGCDVCEELGAQTLSKRLVFFGNAEILLLIYPILSELFTLSEELLL